jgi:hypothetical protein
MLRDWTDSLRFDGITAEAERLFLRLIMKADDYGRFHADPRLIKAACFPLLENLRTNDLSRWLDELSHRQLILRYEAEGRKLLAIANYGQRLKNSRAKFPPLPGKPDDWLPTSDHFREVPGSSGKFPLEEKRSRREGEVETEEEDEGADAPGLPFSSREFETAWGEWMAYRKSRKKPVSDRAMRANFADFLDWGEAAAIESIRASIRSDWQGLFPPKGRNGTGPNGHRHAGGNHAGIIENIPLELS